jgi:putative adhesin
MMKKAFFVMLATTALSGSALRAVPPVQQTSVNDDWCRNDNWSDDRQGYCEVREYVIAGGANALAVDATPNGGIQVNGSGRGDVLVRAKVVATAETEQRAREIANGVRVDATAYKVNADGPRTQNREGWSVSYRLEVPHMSSLALQSTNGGISIDDVEGTIEFKTVNGGVKLSRLAGDVKGRTSNGGVDVDLDGPSWRGEGLDVETSNGGVKLRIPEQYSAHLETGTVNGGLNVDIPITVQGQVGGRNGRTREISADLGGGGPTIRVRTHNGGVKISNK